ncbi:insulin-like receptor isoform X2 [Rhodnius prolixus]
MYTRKGLHEVLSIVMIFMIVCGSAAALQPASNVTIRQEPGICPSLDIRNSVEMFSQLKGCRVVEGFVNIVLIDDVSESDFKNITFPELKEITGYLLLYRVNGLKSIGTLFPKLSVIRGNILFLNYALIVFEMLNLQEVGLSSLTNILRGSVYFAQNPMLCFVNTIDWNIIAPGWKEYEYITGNKLHSECPLCPSHLNCPNSSRSGEPLCWNTHNCQRVCPKYCEGSCNVDGKCCHLQCLGGCEDGQSSDHCINCKNVLFENKCISKCPANTYEYLNRRCVYESECYDMPKPREITGYNMRPNPWKPFKDKCVLECPSGYLEVEVEINGQKKLRCEPCKGICKKECPGIKVDNIASAQKMKGCTLIKGSLEIQIRGGSSAVKELDDNLNMIEEITGYLKVVRSFAIISLNFLKNLKIIHGETLESSKYALVILDNQNLMELWDWEKRDNNLHIMNGRLFFHFNPKLCLSKIDRLREIASLPEYTPLEVASNSNGDKVACDVKVLNATVSKTESESAILVWEQFEHYDPRTLLGYVAHYIEAPFQNVTMYDGRDACGGDGWIVMDVSSEGRFDTTETVILPHLKSYTQYAYYVSTYTIATEKTGAISPIKYFRTKASVPSSPRRLSAYSNSSSELIITWKPPMEPNGNVTYYNVSARWEKDSEDFIEQRNYCLEPITLPDTSGATQISKKDPFPQKDSDERGIWQLNTWTNPNCSQKIADKRQREKEIHLEDSLHDFIYVKRSVSVRKKRSLEKGDLDNMTIKDYNAPTDGKVEYHTEIVSGASLVLRNLRHFALYTITVRACREYEEDEDPRKANRCSQPALVTARTQSLPSADNVDNQFPILELSNRSAGAVYLKWTEPQNPNSLVVTYQIEYRRTDIQNFKPTVECITRKHFQIAGNAHLLSNLHPGNYSLRLRASSLAGVGEYTSFKYFSIEETSTISAYQLYAVILITTSVVSLMCIMALYLRRQNRIPSRKLIASVNPEYVPTVYEPDDWEVARTRVELIREIGQGSFGMVYEGLLKSTESGSDRPCAVKTVNVQAADRDRIEFLNEASVMKAFNTHHVVKLLGVVSQGQPTLVIMELMGRGDLKSYLRSHRPDSGENSLVSPPSQKRILRMAVEIADGMAYLAAKKFVHRDLAARNCMVAEDLTVKIGDFGMTRDIYETEYYRKGSKGLLPVRWMAPESLKDGVFTSFSDAWSYGVVLYEMVTLASQPYQGLTNDQVLRYVIDGGIMSRPERCPDKLYTVMRLCWDCKPTSRPTFLELIEFLESDVDPTFSAISFYHSPEGREARSAAQPLSSCAIASELTPLTASRDADDFSLSDEEDDYKEPSTSSKFSNGSTAPNGYAMSHTHHRNSHQNRELNTTKC